ncbi:MAG: tRNA (guanosine(46)-N7)-methyltransferase TrmB [Saprospiraceae bacterium]|nr:tRNA (guanosine(46)-N7)-methyltransferase TrmB [Saprospiraceae bacterium]
MARRNKLDKFADLDRFDNVYQNFDAKRPALTGPNGQSPDLRGKWASDHYGNDCPLTVELACGRGEYSLALGRQFPDRNFLGIDIKGARIWQGARIALRERLTNIAFLRTRIEMLDAFFAPGEISEIWITFPDPFPRDGKENRRLTSPHFLHVYRPLLASGGVIHLKTDDPGLYAYTLESLEQTPFAHLLGHWDDIYSGELPTPELAFKTYYEGMHLEAGKTIKYVRFTLDPL